MLNAIHIWREYWGLVHKTLETDKTEWEKRAEELEVSGAKFVKQWVAAHKRTQGLYLHLLVAHIPDMVRAHGDLVPYQTSGLEHMHSVRKRIGLRNTNRKKGERTTQIMMQLIAMDEMRKKYLETFDAREHEQAKLARKARAAKRVDNYVAKFV